MTSTTNQAITTIPGVTFGSSILNVGGNTLTTSGTIDGGYVFARRLVVDGTIGFTPLFVIVSNATLTSSTSPPITESRHSYYYYITNSAFNTLILPISTIGGQHFVFRNATTTYLTVNVTYTGGGGGGVSTLTFPPLNTITIMYVGGGTGSAAYAFF
jgi:hypothetical protein